MHILVRIGYGSQVRLWSGSLDMVILRVILTLSMCWWNEIVDISVGSGPIALIFFAGNTIIHILVRFGYSSQVRLGRGSLDMVILRVILMLSMCWWNEIVDISVGSGPMASIFFDGNTIMHNLVRFVYGSKVMLGSGSLDMVILRVIMLLSMCGWNEIVDI
jgi:hypothetical protein